MNPAHYTCPHYNWPYGKRHCHRCQGEIAVCPFCPQLIVCDACQEKEKSVPVNYLALSLRELEDHAKAFRQKTAYEKEDLVEWLYVEHRILQLRAKQMGYINRTRAHEQTCQHLYAMFPAERKWTPSLR